MTPPTSLAELWGERLRKARLKKSLTQIELANRTGLGQFTISHLEIGDHLPSDESKFILAGFFKCSVEMLFPYPSPSAGLKMPKVREKEEASL